MPRLLDTLPTLYQNVLMKRVALPDVVAALPDRATRQLAYEMAVCVCDADGTLSDAERRFLDEARQALGLDAGEAGRFADQACSARTPVDRWGPKKIACLAAPLNGWHRSPVCTSDPGHTWPGRHWSSSSCDWPSGPERSRLRASRP